jgi:hypothetical protein
MLVILVVAAQLSNKPQIGGSLGLQIPTTDASDIYMDIELYEIEEARDFKTTLDGLFAEFSMTEFLDFMTG